MRAVASACLLIAATGCVERYLEIDSNPTGAHVVVNGKAQEQPTPLVIPFTSYGTYRVDAWLPEQPATTEWIELDAPWYQWFPIDLVSELFDPFTHVDRRHVTIELAQATAAPASRAESLQRAEKLRQSTQ
ncbi:MAG: hypothetical protein EXS13_06850 [Planctomycetes bacterium]|nr:hypothetical protein [Planctomycetota bacterium]